MLRRLDEASADIVVASRFAPGGGAPGLGPMRLVISRAAGALARVLLRGARRTTDPLSGYFVVRRSAIHGVPLRPIGFKILLEILVRGRGERVADVPFVFDARAGGRSKASPRAAAALLRQITLLAASNPHDARVWKFGLVGASGLAIDVALFWLQVDRLGIPVVGAGLVAGAVSTVSNFVLNSLFTWADRPASGPPMYLNRMLRYYVTTWAGQVVYLSVLWALTQVGIAPMLANLIGVLTGGALNYVVHNLWTWRHTHAG
jgi:dolichol-phosphate mannosyltransferase